MDLVLTVLWLGNRRCVQESTSWFILAAWIDIPSDYGYELHENMAQIATCRFENSANATGTDG